MAYPLLYEINTRCWLRELSDKAGRPIPLGSVPQAQFAEWQRLGFSHIWLMGAWTSGPLARGNALSEPGLKVAYSSALPDWQPEDVAGSPYAIAHYRVPFALGGEAGLRGFRDKLHEHGLKLVLDFVPNHLGIDHPWVRERPGLFVQSPGPAPETFPVQTVSGERWLAHGKDPYFAAWTDTAQLDYRRVETRLAMTELLLDVASRCDGVRCDMAMLLLNKVFSNTWSRWPATEPAPTDEFWAGAIAKTKNAFPEFMFLAEAYWGLEPDLQGLGFDYTYDKDLYDRLIAGNGAAVREYLTSKPARFLAASAHFVENHDEVRIAARLSLDKHRAAALIILGLPGMRLLHDGQLSGARLRLPVQLARRFSETEQAEIRRMYEGFLGAFKRTAVGNGTATWLNVKSADGIEANAQSCICIRWENRANAFDLVAVNYSERQCSVRVPLGLPEGGSGGWQVSDLLGTLKQTLAENGPSDREFALELGPYEARLLTFSRSHRSARRA